MKTIIAIKLSKDEYLNNELQNNLFENNFFWESSPQKKRILFQDYLAISDNKIHLLSMGSVNYFKTDNSVKIYIFDNEKSYIRYLKINKIKNAR